MRILSLPLSLLALCHVTNGAFPGNFCPAACDFTLNYATFNDTDPWLAKRVRSCRSNLRITSLYLCFDQYCEDDSNQDWVREAIPWCSEHAGVTLPDFHGIVDKWSEQERAAVRRLDADEAKLSPILDEVTVPDAQFLDQAFTTMVWTGRARA